MCLYCGISSATFDAYRTTGSKLRYLCSTRLPCLSIVTAPVAPAVRQTAEGPLRRCLLVPLQPESPFAHVAIPQSRRAPQVIVEPAHDGLDDTMQGLQIGRGLNRDAAPDQRLDIDQFDAQDGDSIGAHAAILAGWRRQFHGNNSPSRLIGCPLAMGSISRRDMRRDI